MQYNWFYYYELEFESVDQGVEVELIDKVGYALVDSRINQEFVWYEEDGELSSGLRYSIQHRATKLH